MTLQCVPTIDATQSPFVKPHFIAELGEEGLTLHEVATSLGADFKNVKAKFERMLTDNRLKSLYAPYALYNENNRLVDSYCLSTDTAKFFVAKWDSELGDGYCRFLIECEKVALRPAAPALTIDGLVAIVNQTYTALVAERAEKEKALARAAYQDRALTTSQQNNAKLTRQVHKLESQVHKLNLAATGQLEYMTIKQFCAAVGIKISRNTNKLVSDLSKLSQERELEVRKIIIGEEVWPSKAFQAAFLNEHIKLIQDYCNP